MQATAPAITCQTIQANLDHAFIVAPGAAQTTAEVDDAIAGSGIERISRVRFERCTTNLDAAIALFVGWDGVAELVCPVLNIDVFAGFAGI